MRKPGLDWISRGEFYHGLDSEYEEPERCECCSNPTDTSENQPDGEWFREYDINGVKILASVYSYDGRQWILELLWREPRHFPLPPNLKLNALNTIDAHAQASISLWIKKHPQINKMADIAAAYIQIAVNSQFAPPIDHSIVKS